MAIQYSGGTLSNTTFVGATKLAIINAMETGLTAAGWTVVSGGGSSNVVLASAITPQGNRIRVQLQDLGGTCASIKINNATGSLSQSNNSAGHLLPAVAKTFRLIATQYQFCCFVPGSVASREFVIASALYIAPFLTTTITSLGLLVTNSGGDAVSTSVPSLRTNLTTNDATSNVPSNYFVFVNSNINESISGVTIGASGCVQFNAPQGASKETSSLYRWYDNSASAVTPIVGWGLTSINDEPKMVGQLWDSFISSESYVMDVSFTFNARSWINLTNSNNGTTDTTRGSLLYLYA